MTFSKYFVELKYRIFLLIFTGLTTFVCSYVHKETLLFLLIQSQNETKKLDLLHEPACYLIFTNITEVFYTYIELASFVTTQTLIIYFVHHLFCFLSPSFYKKEYYKINWFLSFMFLVFLVSIISFISLILPLTSKFFLAFQHVEFVDLHFEAKLNEYFHFFLSVYYTSIIYFQILFFLMLVGTSFVTNSKSIQKFRKVVYFLIVIMSLFISPPDAFIQILIIISLCLIYEITFVYSVYSFLK